MKHSVLPLFILLALTRPLYAEDDSMELARKPKRIREDRALHFMSGISSSLLASAALSSVLDPGDRFLRASLLSGLGLVTAIGLGAGKELLDLSGFGQPDLQDLFCTLLGGALASSSVFVGSQLLESGRLDPEAQAAVFAIFAVVFSLPIVERFSFKTETQIETTSQQENNPNKT